MNRVTSQHSVLPARPGALRLLSRLRVSGEPDAERLSVDRLQPEEPVLLQAEREDLEGLHHQVQPRGRAGPPDPPREEVELPRPVEPAAELSPFVGREVADAAGLNGQRLLDVAEVLTRLYGVFRDNDAFLVEAVRGRTTKREAA